MPNNSFTNKKILVEDELLQDLQVFLQESSTPFHAVTSMSRRLLQANFIELFEGDAWDLQPGKGYFTTRNGSAILAFVYGRESLLDQGIHMLGAHTDSPCLKVKPHPELISKGYFQLGVEVYGGALLNPWFDRDLSLAGRVSYRASDGSLSSVLVDFERAIASIPSLAIHLDREANKNRTINAQKDIPPILMQVDSEQADNPNEPDFRALLKVQILKHYPRLDIDAVLDYELSFYDVQPPALIGLQKDFLASARLDNLLSCYLELQALIGSYGDDSHQNNSHQNYSSLMICTDHEEVGSVSACGAKGPMLNDFLQRLLPDPELRARVIDKSLMISVDNAHGVHPNFSSKHDANHGPKLNQGPVIKINANQRYASNSESSALFRQLCELEKVPVQSFVTRTDLGCGSTIGPVIAAEVGVLSLDIGLATFAMHSARELAGRRDPHYLYRVLLRFFDSRIVRK